MRSWLDAIKIEAARERELRVGLHAERARRKQEKARLKSARKEAWAKLRRGVFWPLDSCPTPGIEAFRTQEEVWNIVNQIAKKRALYGSGGGSLTVRECECGYWHLISEPNETI